MTLSSPVPDSSNNHQQNQPTVNRRAREFPHYPAPVLDELARGARALYSAAILTSDVDLVDVSVAIALHERHRRPFMRWCWLKRFDPLANPTTLCSCLLLWGRMGKPDGMDCCPKCVSQNFKLYVEPEIVYARCGDCKQGTLIDLMA